MKPVNNFTQGVGNIASQTSLGSLDGHYRCIFIFAYRDSDEQIKFVRCTMPSYKSFDMEKLHRKNALFELGGYLHTDTKTAQEYVRGVFIQHVWTNRKSKRIAKTNTEAWKDHLAIKREAEYLRKNHK